MVSEQSFTPLCKVVSISPDISLASVSNCTFMVSCALWSKSLVSLTTLSFSKVIISVMSVFMLSEVLRVSFTYVSLVFEKSSFIGSVYLRMFWIVVSCLALYFFFLPIQKNPFLPISAEKSVNLLACSKRLSINVNVILLNSLVWSVNVLCLSSTVAFKLVWRVSVVFLRWFRCSFNRFEILSLRSTIILSILSKYFSRICSILGLRSFAIVLWRSTWSSKSLFSSLSKSSTLFEKSDNNSEINPVKLSFVLFTVDSFSLTLVSEIFLISEFSVLMIEWRFSSKVLDVSVNRFLELLILSLLLLFLVSESSKKAFIWSSTAVTTSLMLLSWIACNLSNRSDWSAKIESFILAISSLNILDSPMYNSKYGSNGINLSTIPVTFLRKPFSTNQLVISITLSYVNSGWFSVKVK